MLLTTLRTAPTTILRTTHPFLSTSTRKMSTFQLTSYLVTPADLSAALSKNVLTKLSTAPRVIPLCASWFLPNDTRDGLSTFKASRIPHARFFDLDAVKDPASPYPHMLPSAADFAAAMGKLGIRKDDSVVVYDSRELGIFSAPRVGWTLRAFGHTNVHVLNNFRRWCEEGYPLEEGEPGEVESVEYPVPEEGLVRDRVVAFEELREVVLEQNKEGAERVQVLDARSRGRWEGSEPEPRPSLPSGHIPGSISVPVPELLDPKTKAFMPAEELRALFQKKGVDTSTPIICSCGTGVTAAVIDAALTEAGFGEENRRLYDGSWTEWAQRVKPSDNLIKKVG
ncbi:putative thiosulfate sulfurtransferase [Patellaria atrata CBS 101060]|uniref:Thiosulfate sulfurtransferase n=1 Tax=Patellaria atrata CBS 101060 TaxID=1346257 RepID=A0A9P4S889_9PEZI|nr:putative thiosulfate sulfurtransferase [Patellaria atrata CBS 101060]